MNKQTAVVIFKAEVMPTIRSIECGSRDMPMRREAWNNFKDGLCKGGEITSKQCYNWDHPAITK